MAEEVIRKYLRTRQEYQTALDELGRIRDVIRDTASKLDGRNAWNAHVANIGRPSPAPELLKHEGIFGDKWPSAERIADVLANWRAAYEALHSAWGEVDGTDKAGLKSPPELG